MYRQMTPLRYRHMHRIQLGLVTVLMLVCNWGCTGAIADDTELTGEKIQIQGIILVGGTDPHTFLFMSTDSGIDYRIEGTLKDLIWRRFQQENIRLEGVISEKARGPGAPAVFIVHKIISPAL